jgi:hypothetical protein
MNSFAITTFLLLGALAEMYFKTTVNTATDPLNRIHAPLVRQQGFDTHEFTHLKIMPPTAGSTFPGNWCGKSYYGALLASLLWNLGSCLTLLGPRRALCMFSGVVLVEANRTQTFSFEILQGCIMKTPFSTSLESTTSKSSRS